MFALLVCGACGALLLNFTAPNPTGRRYSSRMPLSTGQGTSEQIGLSGELVLADDLHLPRNDAPDQLQCFCNNSGSMDPRSCQVCLVSMQLTSPYRRPDFVAPNFIAEAKNAQNLYYESRDLPEITDYAVAARTLNRPLWVFTRVNTNLDPEFRRVVDTTGGGIVAYFTVPDYIDPVDQAAKVGLGLSLGAAVVIVASGRKSRSLSFKRPATPRHPTDPLAQAIDSVKRTEQFSKESGDRHRDKL